MDDGLHLACIGEEVVVPVARVAHLVVDHHTQQHLYVRGEGRREEGRGRKEGGSHLIYRLSIG